MCHAARSLDLGFQAPHHHRTVSTASLSLSLPVDHMGMLILATFPRTFFPFLVSLGCLSSSLPQDVHRQERAASIYLKGPGCGGMLRPPPPLPPPPLWDALWFGQDSKIISCFDSVLHEGQCPLGLLPRAPQTRQMPPTPAPAGSVFPLQLLSPDPCQPSSQAATGRRGGEPSKAIYNRGCDKHFEEIFPDRPNSTEIT